ncbi:glyoxalase [Nocardioides sp. OK12]|uniref:Catechol 2,3-dioxygenase-like lactoylglutathione lyase family enzyme n=1 Tax=Nocardioides marinisabuli TaxID=419476 RepID=A0A7Y9EYQ5_9ACTN|nr:MULTISPECIES: VOC family protein [Nocardioides]NYD56156.1 catechol 2,3-dioxygenase-like lactoylglutathione lyase family enzyme [Nocardioides marinisabuli]GHJ61110.1 glyoxalase [Nocardioides sp. OK12]
MSEQPSRALHHLDLWVGDLERAVDEWGWLLGELGWEVDLPGSSWCHPDGTYLFLEHSPDQRDAAYDRMRPGVNHLALCVDSRTLLDRMRAESTAHGWHEMYADRYPHAGGEQHTALYVESSEGFEVEVVLTD